MTRTVVAANTCTNSGGGVYNSGFATATGTAITSNIAPRHGGGFYNGHAVTLTNCTITRNLAGYQAGRGRWIRQYVEPTLRRDNHNSIIAENMADDDATTDVWFYRCEGVVSGSNSLIGNGCEQDIFVNGIDGNVVGTSDHPIIPLVSDLTRLDDGCWACSCCRKPGIGRGKQLACRGRRWSTLSR